MKSDTGAGFALDFGATVAMRGWTLGFGASGVANRIEWDALERERFDLQSLFGGGDFLAPRCRDCRVIADCVEGFLIA